MSNIMSNIEMHADTRRLEEGLRRSRAMMAAFAGNITPRTVLVIGRRSGPRLMTPKLPEFHCARCGAEIPRGRAGRTCTPCRQVETQ
jgi:hypothetical protein